MFRISPFDKKEVYKFKEKNLYLDGVTVKEIEDILTNGYSKEANDLADTTLVPFQLTTDLGFAINIGRNYCEVDNTVKELSIVIVVCSEENYKNLNKTNSKLIEDSRSSRTREGLFGDDEYGYEGDLSNLIPAYLIIFDGDKL